MQVYRKTDDRFSWILSCICEYSSADVSYLFQELDKLKQEEDDTSWESSHSDLEATLEATLPCKLI